MVEPLVIAIFLATVANRLIDALVVPLYERFGWDKFSLRYVSWVVGGALVFVSGVNLFVAYLPDVLTGQILTAIVAGGGANFIADLFNSAPKRTGPQ